jgi:regulator of protease activity HflC (stomatin/prohibitin superfamily)
MEATIFSIVFALLSGTYIVRSFRIIEEGEIALVERFGKYQKTLAPGINIVLPVLDRIALVKSSREQVLELKPQPCMTSDNVSVNVSSSMYWQIVDLKKARYNINDVDKSLIGSLTTQIQTQIGRCELDNVIGGQIHINQEVLDGISSDTGDWGIKILRVRLGEITIPPSVLLSMEKQKAAEIEKKAMISLSEGEKASEIKKAQAVAESNLVLAESERQVRLKQTEAIALSIERISMAIAKHEHGADAVQYLLAQKYLETGQAIGQSPSSKVLFMDPHSLPGAIQSLLAMGDSKIADAASAIHDVAISKKPFGEISNIPPSSRNLPDIKTAKPPILPDKTDSPTKE